MSVSVQYRSPKTELYLKSWQNRYLKKFRFVGLMSGRCRSASYLLSVPLYCHFAVSLPPGRMGDNGPTVERHFIGRHSNVNLPCLVSSEAGSKPTLAHVLFCFLLTF